jgi:FtsP/CotA-like multicopper oxidase with cupredoxin domain
VRKNLDLKTVELPPGGRAEFIVTGPDAGQSARLLQAEFETGRIGVENPEQELAKIVATDAAEEPPALGAQSRSAATGWVHPPDANAPDHRPVALRKLYFAEASNGTNGPTRFFVTVEGRTPQVFNASGPPAIVTQVGAVEDWIVANHSGEVHAFHIHGIHFQLLQENGKKLLHPEVRDTVTLPAWNGVGPYPAVKVRVDLRDPRSAGTLVLNCDILHHAEAGMMARIQVNP